MASRANTAVMVFPVSDTLQARETRDGTLPLERGLVTVVVPVLDEAGTLETLLSRVLAVEMPKQVLVIDGGSADGSREILAAFAERGLVEALFDPPERGKGAAIRMALPHARGQVTVIQDADLEYFPEELPRVVEPVLSGQADFCYGSRIRGARHNWWSPFYWGGRFVSLATSLLYGRWVTDEPTCYKAMRTDYLRAMPLRGRGFELEPELTAMAFRWGLRYREVPIRYSPRSREEGKKIRYRDGIVAVLELLRVRVARLGPPPWQSR